MSNRSFGVIVVGILAVIGVGLSGYMFIKNEMLFPRFGSNLTLVGLWEDLDRNTDYPPYEINYNWLLEFSNSLLINSNYVSTSNDNTRLFLLRAGLYKISISALFDGLSSSLRYSVEILKNDVFEDSFEWTYADGTYYHMDSSRYYYSNGADYFEFRCVSPDSDPFLVLGDPYNQLSIEFVL